MLIAHNNPALLPAPANDDVELGCTTCSNTGEIVLDMQEFQGLDGAYTDTRYGACPDCTPATRAVLAARDAQRGDYAPPFTDDDLPW